MEKPTWILLEEAQRESERALVEYRTVEEEWREKEAELHRLQKEVEALRVNKDEWLWNHYRAEDKVSELEAVNRSEHQRSA